MSANVGGLMPILATPFEGNGALDLPGLRRIVEFQVESGVDAVAVFGMASEGFALTTAERREILAETVEVLGGALPIVAGINGTSTATAIEQIREAELGGADVLMVIPPYMVKPPAGTLVEFYGALAAATALPIMVQDAPVMTGVAMSPSVIADLARIDGITSVKVEAPPTLPKIDLVVRATQDLDFIVVGGQNAQFCLDEYEKGSVGTMPACEFSDLLNEVLGLWTRGNREDARLGFQRLLPLILFGLQSGIAWAVHKEVLAARGLIENTYVRYPSSRLDSSSRISLAAILDRLQLPSLSRPVAL